MLGSTVLGLESDLVGTRDAAGALAEAARRKFNADIGLSTTGVFDITNDNSPTTGETYLGIATAEGVEVAEVKLPGNRHRVREFSVISLLNALRLRLDA